MGPDVGVSTPGDEVLATKPEEPSPSSASPPVHATTAAGNGKLSALAALMVAALVVLGLALVVLAYLMASVGPTTSPHYHVFWAGMLLTIGPLCWIGLGRDLSPRARAVVLVALALAAYFPRLVRVPSSPLMNDELGHWAQAEQLYRTGNPFADNPLVSMAGKYPGLHTLTVGLRSLTGLSTFRLATVLVALFHVLTLLGVFQLARRILHDQRAALAASAIYAVSPSFPFFDGMYAYESLGVPLVVWSLVAAVFALDSRGSTRRWWLGASLVIGLGCVVTHHLSSYVLVLALSLLAVAAAVRHRRGSGQPSGWAGVAGVAVVLGLAATLWAVLTEAQVVSYLAVFPRQGLETIHGLITRAGGGAPRGAGGEEGGQPVLRTLFRGTRLPVYERVLAYAVQPLLLAAFVAGWWQRRRQLSPAFVTFTLVGLAYFASLPLVLTPGGSPGAHRSWTFSYLGLAVVGGVGLASFTRPSTRLPVAELRAGADLAAPSSRPLSAPRLAGTARRCLVIAGICAVLMGNYASAVNDQERFPGPFIFGSDGRNVTRELRQLGRWLGDQKGRGRVVLTDGRTFAVLSSYAQARPPRDLSLAWEVFFPPAPPAAKVVAEVRRQHVDFVVVDRRMATDPPLRGYYFSSWEPAVRQPLAAASIDKFDSLPWLSAVHRTPHYSVYEVKRG